MKISKILKLMWKKQSGHTINILRTNRGIDYIICDDLKKKCFIEHQLIVRYTIQ